MGWWKSNENGGIDWKNLPTGHGGNTLVNAIAGRDSPEDYYNGDSPADAMGGPIYVLKKVFANKKKPSVEEMVNFFTKKEFSPIFSKVFKEANGKKTAISLIDKIWQKIDKIYEEAWNRPTYPEERVLICKFCFSCSQKDDWWEISKRQEELYGDYSEEEDN